MLMRFLSRKRRVKVQLVEVVIPIAVRVMDEVSRFREVLFRAGVMNLRVNKARNVTALFREKARHIVGEPAAMLKRLPPKIT